MKFILSLLILVLSQVHGQFLTLDQINYCPETHPSAISRGLFCCSEVSDNIWQSVWCKGTIIPCPGGWNCDNYPQDCAVRYIFSQCSGLGESYVGSWNPKENITEGGRQVYATNKLIEGEVNDINCIWWHKLDRHWQMGPCEEVGGRSTHAYLATDTRCPESKDFWTKAGTNKPIPNVVYWKEEDGCIFSDFKENGICKQPDIPVCKFIIGGAKPNSNTASGGVGVITGSNPTTSQCKNWKFQRRQPQWRCAD